MVRRRPCHRCRHWLSGFCKVKGIAIMVHPFASCEYWDGTYTYYAHTRLP